jgi:hypothetical protein
MKTNFILITEINFHSWRIFPKKTFLREILKEELNYNSKQPNKFSVMLILIAGVTSQKNMFFNWVTMCPYIRDTSSKQQMNVLNILLLWEIMAKAQKLLKMEWWSQLVELTTYAVEQLVSIRCHGWLYLTLMWDLRT